MSKVYFRYGAMNASKSANALMVAFNYKEKGMKSIILKPKIDDRDGEFLSSRIGISQPCIMLDRNDSILQIFENNSGVDCIIVDESQFLTRQQVMELTEIADDYSIPSICYGLRADFKGELFEGSEALLSFADSIEEIKTICWCGRKAMMNARVSNGKVVYHGEQIEIGGNESYTSLCRKHWREGNLG